MKEIKMQIKKPDDTNEYYPTVVLKSDDLSHFSTYNTSVTISYDRNSKDPIHSGLVKFWKGFIGNKAKGSACSLLLRDSKPSLMFIEEMPVAIERKGTRYRLNGKTESISTIANALARVTITAIRTKKSTELLSAMMKVLELSEDVKYCLENRVPFHYYVNFQRVDVRLNVQQISEKECAIEISDGVWASITNKDLIKFCSFFLHDRKQSRYKYMGVERLYTELMGVAPTDSDLELMKQFLMQNRQQDIVEDRAIMLLHEMASQHPERLKLEMDGKIPEKLFIKGQGYDWLLSNTKFKSDIQMVSTFVLMPIPEVKEGKPLTFDKCKWAWKGPICIDNMSRGSSLGDQFATRALALLNDTHTIKIVNTISRYILTPANTNRKDFNEMSRMSIE
tara:strand:- start:581 stop:1759 length:1179 start_codon:yes stop_codon:yes gene_type:complete